MIAKRNAEQIEHFSLVPVSAPPDRCHGIYFSPLTNRDAQPESSGVPERVEDINDLEARLTGPPIHRCYCAKTVEARLSFKQLTNGNDRFTSNTQNRPIH